ncbi:putative acylesterase/phospholipase RssA [Bradyrhizobium sp. I1.8.5]|uniref:patatin-like phospholipase family protein n=1 Tax=Bradyrhizobium sp. I1.8.5 TaxID=3156365 RepID=UPI00339A2507
MPRLDRIARSGQKRLLSIDGGGIRGVLALAILRRIEDLLKRRCGRGDFRLSDYFDYISGTSTGGIIAAGLALGKTVDEILVFYREAGAQMFVKANLLRRLRYKFESEPLAEKLQNVFGAATTFGSDHDRCNRWMLYSTLSHGLRRSSFVALWNGEAGDGPGGTENMIQQVKSVTGRQPVVIDPTKL